MDERGTEQIRKEYKKLGHIERECHEVAFRRWVSCRRGTANTESAMEGADTRSPRQQVIHW